jgi:subtilisin family serine protease
MVGFMLLVAVGNSKANPDNPRTPSYRNDTLLVKFFADQGNETVRYVEAMTRGRVTWQSRLVPGLVVLRVPPGWAETYHEMLPLVNGVEYVRFDWIGQLHTTPNDPLYSSQWHLNSTPTQQAINAPCAWTVITDVSDSKVIAVLDAGVDFNDPDLQSTLWVNSGEIPNNGIDDDLNGYCDDVHGTATAGPFDTYCADACGIPFGSVNCDASHGNVIHHVIAGRGNNSVGGSGVAWKARIMHVRVVGDSGMSDSTVIEGIEYAVDNGAKIINMSFALSSSVPFLPDPLYDVIAAASDQVLFITSAGNEAENIDYVPFVNSYRRPQLFGLTNVLVVAASTTSTSTTQDPRAAFSNWSTTAVDFAAPGQEIAIALAIGCSPSACIRASGTSFAAPMAAAVAGFVWTQNPTWTPLQVRNHIRTKTRPSPQWTSFVSTGGVLDAAASVNAVCISGGEEP